MNLKVIKTKFYFKRKFSFEQKLLLSVFFYINAYL